MLGIQSGYSVEVASSLNHLLMSPVPVSVLMYAEIFTDIKASVNQEKKKKKKRKKKRRKKTKTIQRSKLELEI